MDPNPPRFSGALGLSPLLLTATIVVVVPVLAVAYAWVEVNSPIAGYVSLLYVLAFGYALGRIVGKVGVLARCRSPYFLRWMGAVAGVAGLYVAWGAFEFLLLLRGPGPGSYVLVEMLAHPHDLARVAAEIADTGWYSLNANVTPTGVVLWAMWLVEALLVVGLASWQAGNALDERVFCELCGRWCRPDGKPLRLAVPAGRARARVRAGEVDALVELAKEKPEEDDHVRLDLVRCPGCGETGAFRLQRVAERIDLDQQKHFLERVFDHLLRKGKTKQHVEPLLDYVIRPATELEPLRALRGP